jgi:hypothetical protein
VALLARIPPDAQLAAFGECGDRVVQVLHHQRDHRALAPLADIDHPKYAARIFAGLVQQLLPPWHGGAFGPVAIGHQGLQQPHGIGTFAITDGLDVRVRCRMNRRRDRHPMGQIQLGHDLQRRGTHDRL